MSIAAWFHGADGLPRPYEGLGPAWAEFDAWVAAEGHTPAPNIVMEPTSGEKTFVENPWIGHTLAIGDEVRLSVTGPCPRCVMTTLPQGDLPKDPGILRTAARHNQANVVIYAAVVRGGSIRRGDPVRLAA